MRCLLINTWQESFGSTFKMVNLESKHFENEQKYSCLWKKFIPWRKHCVNCCLKYSMWFWSKYKYRYIEIEFSIFHKWKYRCILHKWKHFFTFQRKLYVCISYMKREFSVFHRWKYRCIFPIWMESFLYLIGEYIGAYFVCDSFLYFINEKIGANFIYEI